MLDFLLKLLGENPAEFPSITDKQAILLEYGLNLLTYSLPIILSIFPIYWFFRKSNKHRKTKKNIIIFTVLCIVLFALGIFIPELIKSMLMGFAVQSFYGGQV